MYNILVSFILVVYSFVAIWIRIDLESGALSETGEQLISVSLLLIPVASITGIAIGWFFHILSTTTETNKTLYQYIGKISFWIPPLAPTVTALYGLII